MKTEYDVIVVGGGPSGMMAAGRAAELGASVLILEKNSSLGKKLRITGGGRCNITNAEFDNRLLAEKYGKKGKAVLGLLARFSVRDCLNFFNSRGLPTKVEDEKRVFPESNNADDVWKVMLKFLLEGKVDVRENCEVTGFEFDDGKIIAVKILGGERLIANKYIVAVGGRSRPETGSTGDGFSWLRELGHKINESDPALVPIKIFEEWPKSLSGLSFKNVKITVFAEGKKQRSMIGKMLFTHFGVSGPLVINLSKFVSGFFKRGKVELWLDLFPDMPTEDVDVRLFDVFAESQNRMLRNALEAVVSERMVKVVLMLLKLDGEKQCNQVTRQERFAMASILKKMPMTVSGFLGVDNAVVTSGGVELSEVDLKTCRSKLYSNLFVIGDMLDFDRPTGGFSLQLCWMTGWVAGENAV